MYGCFFLKKQKYCCVLVALILVHTLKKKIEDTKTLCFLFVNSFDRKIIQSLRLSLCLLLCVLKNRVFVLQKLFSGF